MTMASPRKKGIDPSTSSATTVAPQMVIATGFILMAMPKDESRKANTDSKPDAKPVERLDYQQMGYLRAFLVGCAQAFAILPGISRSGSTIVCGYLLGLNRLLGSGLRGGYLDISQGLSGE